MLVSRAITGVVSTLPRSFRTFSSSAVNSAATNNSNKNDKVRSEVSGKGSILNLTLCSPKTRNALSLDLMKTFRQELSRAQEDKEVVINFYYQATCGSL